MGEMCIAGAVQAAPRVVVVGLASCFGCQLQITNAEAHLLDVLGQIDLRYWQLASSAPMPDEYDVAVIEGAASTAEARETLKIVRERAKKVIAIGSCATTAGLPGLAEPGFRERISEVYAASPSACGEMEVPRPVSDFIEVDYEVRCCPVDPYNFIDILQRALYGSNKALPIRTMCGECKRNEKDCFYEKGQLCLGLVTRADCGGRCVNLGRPCFGCGGLSPDANLESARYACEKHGIDPARFDESLSLFNQIDLTKRAAAAASAEK
jgi:sulfhydrogenase subunit delta